MWCRRKLSILWCLGCNWGQEGLRCKWLGKAKGKDSQKYSGTEWKNVFFFLIRFVFWFCFRSVWCSPGVVRFGESLDVVLYGLFWRWLQILVVFGMFWSVWIWLGWLGNACLISNMWEKRAFWSSFVLIDHFSPFCEICEVFNDLWCGLYDWYSELG